MALLGADNLSKNGKQNLNPDGTPNSLSRSTAFNYQSLGPNFHGVGGMSGDTPDNIARAKAANPTVVPKPVAGPGAGYPGMTGPAPQPSKPFKKDAIDPVLSHADDATNAIGQSFNQSFVNTARDIKKNPTGAIQSRVGNSFMDIGNAVINTGANLSNAEFNTNLPNVSLPKFEGNVPTPDSIVRDVYDSVKRGDGVSAQFLPRVKGGSLKRDVKKGTKWSGGLYVPGDGMETFKRVADAAAAVPVVGKGAKLVAGAADRAIADSIVVNAAEKPIPASQQLEPYFKPIKKVIEQKQQSRLDLLQRQAEQKGMPTTQQDTINALYPHESHGLPTPLRKVTDHSMEFTDNGEFNSQELINSAYRRAQAIAESEGRGTFRANASDVHGANINGGWGATDLQRAITGQWTDVYNKMIADGTLSKAEHPTSDSFIDFLGDDVAHREGGVNDIPVHPTLKAANDTLLEMFHGKGASKKPISYYRNASREEKYSDPTFAAKGDYSLDKDMAYNYGVISDTQPRIKMDVTTDSIRHPLLPVRGPATTKGETRVDEWAQNWHGDDFKPGGIAENNTPITVGPQLSYQFPWNKSQQFRNFHPGFRYGIRDYKFGENLGDIPASKYAEYGLTPDEVEQWLKLRETHFKTITNEQGEVTGRAPRSTKSSEFGNQFKGNNVVGRALSMGDHEIISKISRMMHGEGMIEEPFHYNKFDIPKGIPEKGPINRSFIAGAS